MLIDLKSIRNALARHRPQSLAVDGGRAAAVAMVLRESGNDVQALIIERARRDADPWSGQMAFPGGMVEPQDDNARAAAERETAEEVGLDLAAGRFLGRLDDMQGRHAGHPLGMVVSGYVYAVNGRTEIRPNHEVAEVLWVPLRRFFETERYTTVRHPNAPEQQFPGIRVGPVEHQVVWGLTRRFLVDFFQITELQFQG